MMSRVVLLLGLTWTLLCPPAWAAIDDAEAMNLSGMQRMLSQRIAKLYLALSWHLPIEQLPQSFAHTVGEFEQALLTLQKAPQNTSEINSGLQKVDAQWRFSQAGWTGRSGRRPGYMCSS